MKRYAKILWDGGTHWVEFLDATSVSLLSEPPTKQAYRHIRHFDQSDIQKFRFLPPCNAQKVIGLAYNYKSLVGVRESYEEPLFFLKSATSICGHQSKVTYPEFSTKVWVEVELGIIIKKECRKVSVNDAADYILGYTIGSDITAENVYGRDWHLARSKALDNFAPLGPFLVTDLKTSDLELYTYINGKEFQHGNTSDRIMNDCESVSLISQFLTLMPGDVILTGTPAGARGAIVNRGDVVCHQIDGLGELIFSIV